MVARKQPYVVLDTNHYSIPWQLVGKPVTVSATEEEVRILHEADVVACHPRSWDRKQIISDPAHLEGLRDYKRKAQSLTGRALLFDAVPKARVLYQDLQQRNEALGPHTRRLLGLLEDYGPELVSKAVERAIERGTPRADSVAYILERDFGRPIQQELTPRFESEEAGELTIRNHRLEDYDDI